MTEKLLTLRIEETTRDDFSGFAKRHGSNTTELIKAFITRCLDGSIDLTDFTLKPSSNIDSSIDERIERIESKIDERYSDLTDNINNAIASLRDEFEQRLSAIAQTQSLTPTISPDTNEQLPVTSKHTKESLNTLSDEKLRAICDSLGIDKTKSSKAFTKELIRLILQHQSGS